MHWHTATDNLHVATPILNHLDKPTKRQVTSDVAKTFDILRWHAPAIVKIKILLQIMWQRKLKWVEAVPEEELLECLWSCNHLHLLSLSCPPESSPVAQLNSSSTSLAACSPWKAGLNVERWSHRESQCQ